MDSGEMTQWSVEKTVDMEAQTVDIEHNLPQTMENWPNTRKEMIEGNKDLTNQW